MQTITEQPVTQLDLENEPVLCAYKDIEDGDPKYGYTAVARGQANFIRKKCCESNIRTAYHGSEVKIFAKRKLDEFHEIVKISLALARAEPLLLEKPLQVFKKGQTLMGVAKQSMTGDLIICTDSHYEDIVFYQFIGKIPMVKKYLIFTLHREMIEYLEEVEKVLI